MKSKPGFSLWVKDQRDKRGLSQDGLAERVEAQLGRRYTQNSVAKLEGGIPANPIPDLVSAYAAGLGRPLAEALTVLGYTLPKAIDSRVSPDLSMAVTDLSLPQQAALAAMLPNLIQMAARLSHPPVSLTDSPADTPPKKKGKVEEGEPDALPRRPRSASTKRARKPTR